MNARISNPAGDRFLLRVAEAVRCERGSKAFQQTEKKRLIQESVLAPWSGGKQSGWTNEFHK